MFRSIVFTFIFGIYFSSAESTENPNPLNTISLSSNPASTQITHLPSYSDLELNFQCEHLQAQYCFYEIYRNQTCLEKVKKEFKESEWKTEVEIEYTNEYMNYFLPCVENQTKNYTRANDSVTPKFNVQWSSAISMLPPKFYDEKNNFQRAHQKCIIDQIKRSFIFTECYMKSHFIVIDKTLEICRHKALKTLTNSSSLEPPATEILNAKSLAESVEEIGKQKIGSDFHSSSKLLSQKALDIFGNLSYDHLEAVREIALLKDDYKRAFCDPNYPLPFYIEVPPKNVTLFKGKQLTKYFSEKWIKFYETFTDSHFWAIKEVINVNPHFRWFLCSSLSVIQRPSTFTFHLKKKAEESSKCENTEEEVSKDPYEKLEDCRKLANKTKSTYNGICSQ